MVPWALHGQERLRLGSSLTEAFCSWGATEGDVRTALDAFEGRKYVLSVTPTSTVHVLLLEGSEPEDHQEAAFMAHQVLHRLETYSGTARRGVTDAAQASAARPASPNQTMAKKSFTSGASHRWSSFPSSAA